MSKERKMKLGKGIGLAIVTIIVMIITIIISNDLALRYTGIREVRNIIMVVLFSILVIAGFIIKSAIITKKQKVSIEENMNIIKKRLGSDHTYKPSGKLDDFMFLVQEPDLNLKSAAGVDITHVLTQNVNELNITAFCAEPYVLGVTRSGRPSNTRHTVTSRTSYVYCKDCIPKEIDLSISSCELTAYSDALELSNTGLKKRRHHTNPTDFRILSNDNNVGENAIEQILNTLREFTNAHDHKVELRLQNGSIHLMIKDFVYFNYDNKFRVDAINGINKDLDVLISSIHVVDECIKHVDGIS